MHDLRAILVRKLVQRTLETGAPCLERPRSDVILEQLSVHDIDDSRDQRLDVFGTADEGLYIFCTSRGCPLVPGPDATAAGHGHGRTGTKVEE
jgi:hypothetical protein